MMTFAEVILREHLIKSGSLLGRLHGNYLIPPAIAEALPGLLGDLSPDPKLAHRFLLSFGSPR